MGARQRFVEIANDPAKARSKFQVRRTLSDRCAIRREGGKGGDAVLGLSKVQGSHGRRRQRLVEPVLATALCMNSLVIKVQPQYLNCMDFTTEPGAGITCSRPLMVL